MLQELLQGDFSASATSSARRATSFSFLHSFITSGAFPLRNTAMLCRSIQGPKSTAKLEPKTNPKVQLSSWCTPPARKSCRIFVSPAVYLNGGLSRAAGHILPQRRRCFCNGSIHPGANLACYGISQIRVVLPLKLPQRTAEQAERRLSWLVGDASGKRSAATGP